MYPLLNASCPADPEVTVANITLRRVVIDGGLFSPGVILANESNPFTNIVFDSVVVINGSTWPIADGQYLVRNAHGSSVNGSSPAPAFDA